MKQESEDAHDNFLERGPNKFCKAFISLSPVCDMIDNNVSETFNGYVVNARGKLIIYMLEDIRCSLMERQVKKLSILENWKDSICLQIRKKLENLKMHSRNCQVHPAMGGKFEVHHHDDKFVVVIKSRTCTCRVWELNGIPCMHAIAALTFLKVDPVAYVHEYYTIKRYILAYAFGLESLYGKKMWPDVEGYTVLPPHIRRMPGRPKLKRKRDSDEVNPNDTNKLKKNGVTMTCRRKEVLEEFNLLTHEGQDRAVELLLKLQPLKFKYKKVGHHEAFSYWRLNPASIFCNSSSDV
ncbi:uncharacterized protein LOC130993934 [Salvia miltiorrhiza]|uniref:uncharacterized protein LOC130993934 n=1 Tax=Salvia miltiorrhiza TaxID=226208 RepID=UPI0025AC49AD|nr:uncharacterized protein LOC130993934 [Salvia miltiorrhiza]